MKKFLTISELEQGDPRTPIWAVNGSAQSEVGQPGEAHVGIPKINGTKIDPLFLPQTWLAQNLTAQIPSAQLLAASEFRNAVNSGLIVLVTPEYAAALNAREGAEEERATLLARRRQVATATAARTITQSGAEIINTSEVSEPSQTTEVAAAVSDVFLTFVSSLGNKTDIEVMNALRSRGKMTRREVKHLIKTLTDKPKTVAFLKGKL